MRFTFDTGPHGVAGGLVGDAQHRVAGVVGAVLPDGSDFPDDPPVKGDVLVDGDGLGRGKGEPVFPAIAAGEDEGERQQDGWHECQPGGA